MQRLTLVACALLAVGACSSAPVGPGSNAMLFEGARLIVGDESAPIENAAFLVEDDTFTRVGRKGEVPAPDGAARVDLAGQDGDAGDHQRARPRRLPQGRELHGRELHPREHPRSPAALAYHGVAAVMSMGAERPERATRCATSCGRRRRRTPRSS